MYLGSDGKLGGESTTSAGEVISVPSEITPASKPTNTVNFLTPVKQVLRIKGKEADAD